MKVTTTLRDNGKVNQIVPIMQEHLGSVMNLARIKLLAFVLQALCVVQTVSLHKIASAMPTCVERDSNLRRLQRFLAGYALNLDLIAKVIFALLPVKTGLVLSLDRTNWKFGEVNINKARHRVSPKPPACSERKPRNSANASPPYSNRTA